MYTYDEPLVLNYNIEAATLSSAAELMRIIGPAGMQGRVVALGAVVTTAITVAAADITVGTVSDGDAYATMDVAVGAADTSENDFTNLTDDDNLIAADAPVILAVGGAPDAGAASISLTIAWFKV